MTGHSLVQVCMGCEVSVHGVSVYKVDECGQCGLSVLGAWGEYAGCRMSVRGMGKRTWGMERVCTVWGVWGVSVHAEGKYMGLGVSVHSVGYVGGMRSGDECQGMCMGAGGAWHKLGICRKVSLRCEARGRLSVCTGV